MKANTHTLNLLILRVLDEPLNGLDKKSQQMLLTLLQEKATYGGIILTTHHDAHVDLLNPVKVEVLEQHLVNKSCENLIV